MIKVEFCQFCQFSECYATLRVFTEFFCKKIAKKIFTKKNFLKICFLNFFWYRGSTANLGYACKNLGCLGLEVLEEIVPAPTVVNPNLYILLVSGSKMFRTSA
jgi:hypothetical protein